MEEVVEEVSHSPSLSPSTLLSLRRYHAALQQRKTVATLEGSLSLSLYLLAQKYCRTSRPLSRSPAAICSFTIFILSRSDFNPKPRRRT